MIGNIYLNILLLTAINVSVPLSQPSHIEFLTGNNYKRWRRQLDTYLGAHDYDICLSQPEPVEPPDSASSSVKARFSSWQKANKMSLLIIQSSISEPLRAGIPSFDTAKELLDIIEGQFIGYAKASIMNLFTQLFGLHFDQGSVREFISKLCGIVYQLRDLGMNLDDDFIVYSTMSFLPKSYETFVVNHNTSDRKWSVNELINQCVLEEGRQKSGIVAAEHAHLTHSTNSKNFGKRKRNDNKPQNSAKSNQPERLCYYCKQPGHVIANCEKLKKTNATQNAQET